MSSPQWVAESSREHSRCVVYNWIIIRSPAWRSIRLRDCWSWKYCEYILKKKKNPIVIASSIVCCPTPKLNLPKMHSLDKTFIRSPRSSPLILQHAEQQQFDRTATQCLWGIGKIAGTAPLGQPIRLRLPFVLVVAFPTQRTTAGSLHALPVAIAAEGPKRGGPARSGVQMLRYVCCMRGQIGVQWSTVEYTGVQWLVALPNPETADAKLISFICQDEARRGEWRWQTRNKTKHCKS